MLSSLLLVTLLAADPTPPIVGRPLDFSGAVGGPFTVTFAATPTTLAAEEPLTLTLRITGFGNLADLRRPDLAGFDANFAVEPLDDAVVPGGREFRYRLRPRTANVTEVPRYKFVYFNPRLPSNLGYQTTYADPVRLTVTAKSSPTSAKPTDVPEWMRQEFDWSYGAPMPWLDWLDRALGSVGLTIPAAASPRMTAWASTFALALPPLFCAAAWFVWRRRHPDAARAAARRRNRAAGVALRALQERSADPAARTATILGAYLHSRGAIADPHATSAEIAAHWRTSADRAALRTATVAVLRQCDTARFSPVPGNAPTADEAARLVLAWEAEP